MIIYNYLFMNFLVLIHQFENRFLDLVLPGREFISYQKFAFST